MRFNPFRSWWECAGFILGFATVLLALFLLEVALGEHTAWYVELVVTWTILSVVGRTWPRKAPKWWTSRR